MLVVGLTGTLGAGKTTVAGMLAAAGAPVHDADEAVHDLYRGAAVAPVGDLFPEAVVDGVIDRTKLAAIVAGDADALKRLEAVVHPLVREAERDFLDLHRDAPLVVLDIPLLLETRPAGSVDLVMVVTAPEDVRKARVADRSGMTAERFDQLDARQMADAEKRARAHVVIDNGRSLAATEAQVAGFLRAFAGRAFS